MTPASSTAVCAQRGLFEELLDGTYDCIDRVVLRAYFQLAQEPAGLRIWWRRWMGSDDGLDNTHLMRIAGRFARRVKGWAKVRGVPILFSKAGGRNEDLAAPHRPEDPHFEGTFAIVVNRAPGNVWNVEHTADGRIRRIKRKEPKAWVNHYAFHIMVRIRRSMPWCSSTATSGWRGGRCARGSPSPRKTTASPSSPTPGTWAESQRP